MNRKATEDAQLMVSIHREFWTGASQQDGRPARVLQVLDLETVQAADLLNYQMLGGFNTATPAVPESAAEVRFTNGRDPKADPGYGDQEVEFCWMQVHEFNGRAVTPDDICDVADMLGIPLLKGADLEERRHLFATNLFEEADFGEIDVADHNGWEISGDRFTKVAFMDVGGEETARMVYTVEFTPGTAGLARLPEFELPELVAAEEAEPSF